MIIRSLVLTISVMLFAGSLSVSGDDKPADGKPKVIYWQDLMPENEDIVLEALQKQQESTMGALSHSMGAGGAQRQLKSFNVVQDYDGQKVKLPGFVVPLEFSPTGEVSEFLFVPYQGACVHLPPPPPNQIVYAKAKEKTYFGDMWSPIWLIGTMRTEQYLNDMGDAAYTLEIDRWEQYLGRE